MLELGLVHVHLPNRRNELVDHVHLASAGVRGARVAGVQLSAFGVEPRGRGQPGKPGIVGFRFRVALVAVFLAVHFCAAEALLHVLADGVEPVYRFGAS